MKMPRFPLAALAGLLFPLVSFAQTEPIYHPTVVAVDYDSALRPIVAAVGESPQVTMDGHLVKMRHDAPYQLQRATAYLAGSAVFEGQTAGARATAQSFHWQQCDPDYPEQNWNISDTLERHGEYSAYVTSDRDQKACYVAVVFVDREYLADRTPDSSAQVTFESIGDLTKGRRTLISFQFKDFDGGGKHYDVFPLLFSHGMEIRTNRSADNIAFFRRQDEQIHRRLLERYVEANAGRDHPLQPYLRVSPDLVTGFGTSSPVKVAVTGTVEETGELNSVEINPTVDPQMNRWIRESLGEWRFLPRLVQGRAVETRIKIPLEIPPTSPTS